MDMGSYLQFVVALVFVLALIVVLAMVARRFGLGHGGPVRRGKSRRLAVSEALALDGKRRLVLVRRDATEHLIILGPTSETVVETGIGRPPAGSMAADGTPTPSATDARSPPAREGKPAPSPRPLRSVGDSGGGQ